MKGRYRKTPDSVSTIREARQIEYEDSFINLPELKSSFLIHDRRHLCRYERSGVESPSPATEKKASSSVSSMRF